MVLLLITASATAWVWLRPYEWRPDAGARFRIEGVVLTRDHANHWLDVRLKKAGDAPHDLQKPVRLMIGAGRELAPAETTLIGEEGKGTTGIWLRFWLEPGDLNGPIRLHLNDGILLVKASQGEPQLGTSARKFMNSTHW